MRRPLLALLALLAALLSPGQALAAGSEEGGPVLLKAGPYGVQILDPSGRRAGSLRLELGLELDGAAEAGRFKAEALPRLGEIVSLMPIALPEGAPASVPAAVLLAWRDELARRIAKAAPGHRVGAVLISRAVATP